MSVAAQRALRLAIDNGRFDPVYYLHGDDDFRKTDAIGKLVAGALDPSTRDFNYDTFRGAEVDAGRLAAALTLFPVLAPRRVVVLRDVNLLKKAARAELIRYLKKPASDTLLLLTSQAGEKPDADIAGLATSVPFPTLTADKLPSWITTHARERALVLPDGAAELIAQAVDGDLVQAVGEIDKLVSYTNGRSVEGGDVEAILGVRRGETVVDLLDAIAARDAARAVHLVNPVLSQPKTNGVQIVMFLATQTIAMAWARAARGTGMPASRLEGEFINLLRSGGGFPGRGWNDAAKCWASNLPKWSANDLERGIRLIAAADVALKDTRVSTDEQIVTSLALALCAGSHQSQAA